MASALASKRTFKTWLRKTQPLVLAAIRQSQEVLDETYDLATSLCIEVDHVFYSYEYDNRGKNMLFSALKAIHAKHSSVDVSFDRRDIMREVTKKGKMGSRTKTVTLVDGHLIVCSKCKTPDDRGRKIAYIHVMKKGFSSEVPDNDEVCNFLDDLSDDSDDEDSKQGQLDGSRDDVSHDPDDEDEYGFGLFD